MNLFSIFRKPVGELEERLFAACTVGDYDEVVNCLKEGANVNKVCSNGRTPLGVAAQLGSLEILKALIEKPHVNDTASCKTDSSSTPNLGYFIVIHDDINSTQNDCAHSSLSSQDALCVKGIDFDDFTEPLIERLPRMPATSLAADDDSHTPEGMENLEWDSEINDEYVASEHDPWAELYLWYANILSQTGMFLEREPPPDDIDGEDQFGCAPLHYAAIEGKKDAIRILLDAGAKINVKDSDNFTPLHLVASKDQPEILKYLLECGANVSQRSQDGISPLHIAASRGLVNNVLVLLKNGAGINAGDLSDRTPLYLAVSRKHIEVVECLIQEGARVNLANVNGYTPLFEAVCTKNVQMVEILLQAGATITYTHFPLHYAILHQQEAMVRLLVKAGCNLNARDVSGNTPLMLAARAKNCQLVKILLKNGASVQSVNSVSMHTVLQEVICFMTKDCEHFMRMFSMLEDYGWKREYERNVLSYAMLQKNRHAIASIVKRWDVVEREASLVEGLVMRGELYLVELILQAGFDLHLLEPFDFMKACPIAEPCREFVIYCLMQPKSLSELSRIRIRRSLKTNLFKKINQLYLPNPLKAYLRMEDLPCPCQKRGR